ncbi:MAG: TonB-dependent receptor [Candidatus Theseobacter exili]|nr:TonB-dependent receptor [Candidatus Theseobacter exili]
MTKKLSSLHIKILLKVGLFFGLSFVFFCPSISAEQDSIKLPAITVTDFKEDKLLLSGKTRSVPFVLNEIPGLLMNSQGNSSVQSDLSIRGSSFSEAGLCIEGLALDNPQTEHFNTNLDLPGILFGQPEILYGLSQTRYAQEHLVGSVNLDFLQASELHYIDLAAGEKNMNRQDIFIQFPIKPLLSNEKINLGFFLGRDEEHAINVKDNNLDSIHGGIHIQSFSDSFQTDMLFSRQQKKFGARGYYGANPDWPAEEKLDDRLLLISCKKVNDEESFFRVTAAWKELSDDYYLYWSFPGLYKNHTKSTEYSFSMDGEKTFSNEFGVIWRVGADKEKIDSSGLGNHHRENLSILLLPEWQLGKFLFTIGTSGEWFSESSFTVLPKAGIDYSFSDSLSGYCSYTETIRQPSYTELNYDSPDSLGNKGLENQKARSFDLGIKGQTTTVFDYKIALFLRNSENTIDWIWQDSDSTRWVATNLGNVNIYGSEAGFNYYLSDIFTISSIYSFLKKEHNKEVYASRYSLDYPEHLLQFSITWNPFSFCELKVGQTLRWQKENPARSGSSFGADGRLALRFIPRKLSNNIVLTFLVENIWNHEFETLPGLPNADRRASATVTMKW